MATNERPNRLVVALGIATIVLFSANLLAMISQRVWPQLHDALFAANEQVEFEAPELIVEERAPQIVVERVSPKVVVGETFHIVHSPKNHKVYRIQKDKCKKRHRHSNHTVTHILNGDRLDLDINNLERSIELEMERLNVDMSDMQRNLESAMSIRLHLDGLDDIMIKRESNLSELEEQLESVSKRFEVRVREHEAAARARMEAVDQSSEKRKARIILREHKEN